MWAAIGLVLVLGLAIKYWWIVVGVAIFYAVHRSYMARDAARYAAQVAETERRARLIAAADEQHAWVYEGDPRGTFGEGYVPIPE